MNEELIQGLVDQCTYKKVRNGREVEVLKSRKFAELIVRECIAQCWTVSELEHQGNVISECSKRMRKHFGVE